MLNASLTNSASSQLYYRNLSLPTTKDDIATLLNRLDLVRKGILPPEIAMQAKHSLTEAFLPLITSLAKQYTSKHHFFYILDEADLVQEGCVALFQSLEQINITTEDSFRAYSIAIIRSALGRAYGADNPMCPPHSSYYRLKQKGAHLQFRRHISSLDAPLYREDNESDTLIDHLSGSLLELSRGDVFNESCCPKLLSYLGINECESKSALIEKLLASLTLRQEQVLRLRYGLDSTDGRAYTQEEVAELLSLSISSVKDAELRALKNLRTRGLSLEQRPTRSLVLKGNKNACHRTEAGLQKIEHQRLKREERLRTAYEQLKIQGVHITRDVLSRAAHADNRVVSEFLRKQNEEHSSQTSQKIEERLNQAYTYLQAMGGKPTIKRLTQVAHVGNTRARAFLHSRNIKVERGRPKNTKVPDKAPVAEVF